MEKLNASFLFMPPWSPDFNPIEEFFGVITSKFKEKYGAVRTD